MKVIIEWISEIILSLKLDILKEYLATVLILSKITASLNEILKIGSAILE